MAALALPARERAHADRRSAASVKVELIRNFADVPADALDPAEQETLLDRLDWFRRTWEHCPPGRAPLIAHATAGTASAYLMLALTEHGRAVALASWYTLAYRPIFTGNPDAKTQARLLTAIAHVLRREARRVVLDPVPSDVAAQLVNAFVSAFWFSMRTPHVANWTVDVTGQSFTQYWAERPGQLRSTAKRKAAKAGLALTVHTNFDEAAWNDYESIYAESWKPDEGSLAFLRATALAKGASGRLRLGIAHKDGRAIAAQLWTVDEGVAYIHKLAHRIDVDALSPGTILTKAMFEHVIDRDQVTVVDFGTGDDRYKADWMTDRHMLERVELYNLASVRGVGGAARALAAQLVARLRTL